MRRSTAIVAVVLTLAVAFATGVFLGNVLDSWGLTSTGWMIVRFPIFLALGYGFGAIGSRSAIAYENRHLKKEALVKSETVVDHETVDPSTDKFRSNF